MAGFITTAAIRNFLSEVAQQYPYPSNLYLLGGAALLLMGSNRATLDLDYLGHDVDKDPLQLVMDQIAEEMHLDVEAVPLSEFIPIPQAAADRHQLYDKFGSLQVYLYDPVTISLSKLDRGFDADIDDVVFLLRSGRIELADLEQAVDEAFQYAVDFNLDRAIFARNLRTVRQEIAGE